MDVIVYHNPDCGTSRDTLGLIRNSGVEPHIIEYLKTPPSRALLAQTHRARQPDGPLDLAEGYALCRPRPWRSRIER